MACGHCNGKGFKKTGNGTWKRCRHCVDTSPHWTDDCTDEDLVVALCEGESGLTEWEMSRATEWWNQVLKKPKKELTGPQKMKAIEIIRERKL